MDCTQADRGITLLRLAHLFHLGDVILLDSRFDLWIGSYCFVFLFFLFFLKSTALSLNLTLLCFKICMFLIGVFLKSSEIRIFNFYASISVIIAIIKLPKNEENRRIIVVRIIEGNLGKFVNCTRWMVNLERG